MFWTAVCDTERQDFCIWKQILKNMKNLLVMLEKQNDLTKKSPSSSVGKIGQSSLELTSAQAFPQTCGSSLSLSCHLIHQSSQPDPPVPKVRMKEHLPAAEVSVHGRRKVRGP